MTEDIFDILLSKLDEVKKPIGDSCVGFAAEDIREYGYFCGQIKGLDLAKREITRLRSKLKENVDG